MTTPLRYPPPANWNDELDAIERSFETESWEGDPPAAGERREPAWHGWLSTLLWPIAALCAVGWMIAVVG